MNTAKILYEQYKVLPKKVQKEFKALIISEEEPKEQKTLMAEIEESLEEIKAMKDGKIPSRTYAEFRKEMENGK